MPLAFPFALADFQDVIRFTQRGFYVKSPMNVSRTAGGTPLRSSIGEPVWRGSFQVMPTNDRSKAARIQALLSVLDRAGSSFLVYDPAKPYPAADPDGSILGASTPSLRALDASDARLISLKGLPANYVLTAGDYIGFTFTLDSVLRYSLHQVVSDETAEANGETALFEVSPFIQPGTAPDDPVTLIKPPMKAVLDPDPNFGMARAIMSEAVSFEFFQALR